MYCKHPKIVVNPYTRERMFVPCGKCIACLVNKQNVVAQKVKNECDKYNYNIFCTLTYSNDCIPCVRVNDTNIYRGVKCVDVIDTFDSPLQDKITPNLYIKVDGEFIPISYDTFGVLYYKDFQNFLKKLRNGLQKKFKDTSYEKDEYKLRYCVACEYGGKRHRPHLHAIFHVNNKEVAEYLLSAILSAWSFCDWDKISRESSDGLPSFVSSDKGSEYVSKYATKFDLDFPLVGIKDFMPKTKYSKFPYYGLSAYDNEVIKKIVTGDSYEICRHVIKKSGVLVDIPLSSSVCNFLFRRFSEIDTVPFERLIDYVTGVLSTRTQSIGQFAAKVRKNCIIFFGKCNASIVRFYLENVQRFFNRLKSYKLKVEMETFDKDKPKEYIKYKYQTLSPFYIERDCVAALHQQGANVLDEYSFRFNNCIHLKRLFYVLKTLFCINLEDLCYFCSSSPSQVFQSKINDMLYRHRSYVSLKDF